MARTAWSGSIALSPWHHSDGIDSWADTGFLDLTALHWAVCGLFASPGRAGSHADCLDLFAISVGGCGLSTWSCVSRSRPNCFLCHLRGDAGIKKGKDIRGGGGGLWLVFFIVRLTRYLKTYLIRHAKILCCRIAKDRKGKERKMKRQNVSWTETLCLFPAYAQS